LTLTERGFLNLLLLTGEPYISPVIFTPDENPSIYFAMRVDNAAGFGIGILVSQYHASNLQAIVAQSNRLRLVGEGSFAVLLDENNLRLAQGKCQRYTGFVSHRSKTYDSCSTTRRIQYTFGTATDYPFQAGLVFAERSLLLRKQGPRNRPARSLW
jgi:hypothetical protein